MFLAIGALVLVLVVMIVRIRFARGHNDVLVGPQLHARLQDLFAPYEGSHPTPESLQELERRADTAFRDILTGVGLVPTDWAIRVVIDDILGPVPHVHGPHGVTLTVADFEHQLREGVLDLAGR